jgi:NAD+ synthase (glutamine-hydrolysing)
MTPTGFLRISAICVPTSIANPKRNREAIENAIQITADSDILLFGELTLSGYTCGELFLQSTLLDSCRHELFQLCKSVNHERLVVVGTPWVHASKLYNCAAIIWNHTLLGLVPKQHLPTYQEFYEGRWFQSGSGVSELLTLPEQAAEVPFGPDLLFECGAATIGVEICEDLWVPVPPSSIQTIAGANVCLNLSASNETVGKASYRQRLVAAQSGRCNVAYAYASVGPTESTTDLVFGAHCMIAENGSLLEESKRIGTGLQLHATKTETAISSMATADVDLGRLEHDRRMTGTMHQTNISIPEFRKVSFHLPTVSRPLKRFVDPRPFVPSDPKKLAERCAEVFEIQVAALAKRICSLSDSTPLTIGVSGGLDSTLALLVAARMFDSTRFEKSRLLGLTMPGFGTSTKTKNNAIELMRCLGIKSESIDIRASCLEIFRNLGHRPFGIDCRGHSIESLQHELEQLPDSNRHDLVFENVQARMRTLLLMSRGFVIGTGDLSEGALGWSTYNADHMSMYNVNCSVPKTLVRFLVEFVANHEYASMENGDNRIRQILLDIAATPISPELLPLAKDKSVSQATEDTVGPYELHDFFLYHFVRSGAPRAKILELASEAAFSVNYSQATIESWLTVFFKRFFQAQYKRSCVPDGPKVGTVSLSPRGDWRMPSDADPELWQ